MPSVDIYPSRTTIRILTNYYVKGKPDLKPEPLGSITFRHYHNMNDIQKLLDCISSMYAHDPVKMKIEMEVTND
jgi:hypothetical protein